MERLTDDRFLKNGFYQPKSKEEEKEIRSIENDLTFEKLYKHCAEVEKQNAELQKQLDELKERNYWLESEHEYQCEKSQFKGVEKGQEQTVKDTAKGIYKDIGKGDILVVQTQEYGEIEVVSIERLKEIIKSKGVEVE